MKMGEFLDSFVYEESSPGALPRAALEALLPSFAVRALSLSVSLVCFLLHAIFFSLGSSRQANVVSHGAERILAAF
jgi:hypothetical protein